MDFETELDMTTRLKCDREHDCYFMKKDVR